MLSMTNERRVVTEDFSWPQQAYIEVIAEVIREKGTASTTDVANRLSVTLPSVSEAVGRLVGLGLVTRKSRFEIGLTAQGQQVAEQLDRRHESLRQFMTGVMAMENEEADKVACRLEHYVDGDFAERLVQLAEFLKLKHPQALRGIAEHVGRLKDGKHAPREEHCGR